MQLFSVFNSNLKHVHNHIDIRAITRASRGCSRNFLIGIFPRKGFFLLNCFQKIRSCQQQQHKQTKKKQHRFHIIHQGALFLTEKERASLNFNFGCTIFFFLTYKSPFWDTSSLGHSDFKSFVFFAKCSKLAVEH